jgi:hypothetical protein
MAKFSVKYRLAIVHEVEVDAESEDEARSKVEAMGDHELIPEDPNDEDLEIVDVAEIG